jgi:hypothetical protein
MVYYMFRKTQGIRQTGVRKMGLQTITKVRKIENDTRP